MAWIPISVTANAALIRRLNARNSLSGQYMFTQYSLPRQRSCFIQQRDSDQHGSFWLPARVEPTDHHECLRGTTVDRKFKQCGCALLDQGLSERCCQRPVPVWNDRASTYTHNTSGGGGFFVGAEVDSVTGGFTREFEKKLTIGLTGGYMRTSGLLNQENIDAKFGAAMATMRAEQECHRIRELYGEPINRRVPRCHPMPSASCIR